VDFRILGPLEVVDERGPVEISGANARAVLAALLLDAERPVSSASLIETVWGAEPPDSAPAMLRNAISQLRRQLGEAIETTTVGYRLRLGPNTLDAQTFTDLVESGRAARRAGYAEQASSALGSALDLWRGHPLDGVGRNGEFDLRTNELEALRRAAVIERIDADLELGGNESAIVAEAGRLVEEEPYNERLRAQLMTALYRVGRQADALDAYQDARRALAGDLGLEPGEGLRELERRILQHDPQLEAQSRETIKSRGRSWWLLGVAAAVAVSAVALVMVTGGSTTRVYSVPASSLAALDAQTGQLLNTASLGGTPTSVTADASGAWTATTNRTVVRSSNRGGIVQTFGVGFAPVDIAQYGRTVWLVSRGYLRQVTRFQAGELNTYVLGTRNGQAGGAGRELHVAADAGGAWVGDGGSGIYRLDGDAARLVATEPDGLGSQHGGDLVVGGGSVWVSDASHDGVVTRLDPVTGGELASISIDTGTQANGPATFGDGALWTIGRSERTVWRIGTEANAITQTIELGVGTVGLAFTDGALWAANEIDRTLQRIDPHQGRVAKTWHFTRTPVAVAASGKRVWVAFS
jgi:DNA-binding SARP family transcriptional activator